LPRYDLSLFFLTWAPVESWLICKLLTLDALLAFAFDILDFCVFLLGLSLWCFAALGMFYNPSSGDLRLFSRRDMHSGFDKVHVAYPQPKDQSILIFYSFCLKPPIFISFLVACGYLTSPFLVTPVVVSSPLSTYSVDFW
jgi:hypothetical protein